MDYLVRLERIGNYIDEKADEIITAFEIPSLVLAAVLVIWILIYNIFIR